MLGFGFFVLLIAVGVALALAVGKSTWMRQIGGFRPFFERPRHTPRELLGERLTRGEVSQQEYEAICGRLESGLRR